MTARPAAPRPRRIRTMPSRPAARCALAPGAAELAAALLLSLCLAGLAPRAAALAAEAPAKPGAGAATKPGAPAAKSESAPADTVPVVTHHEIVIDGKTLRYTVTTGTMPLKNESGETEARIFFMAYAADRAGGPACASRA